MRELMHETVRHLASGGRTVASTEAKAIIGATEHGSGQLEVAEAASRSEPVKQGWERRKS